MKKAYRKGFTLIEILLFVAITSALFVGVAMATRNSIYQQRFMDSTQNLAVFLKSIYSEATNMQSGGGGRSLNKALYGKVVTFEKDESTGDSVITMYTLIADARKGLSCAANTPIKKLSCLKGNVIKKTQDATGVETLQTAGYVTDYKLRWNARLQTADAWGTGWEGPDKFSSYQGIMIVTHSPDAGSLYTYVLDKMPPNEGGNDPMGSSGLTRNQAVDLIIKAVKSMCSDPEVNSSAYTCQEDEKATSTTTGATGTNNKEPKNPFAYRSTAAGDVIGYYFDDFEAKTIELCVNPEGDDKTDLRRNVRIIAGAHNESGVEVPIDEKPPERRDANDNNYNMCK